MLQSVKIDLFPNIFSEYILKQDAKNERYWSASKIVQLLFNQIFSISIYTLRKFIISILSC